jgi:hypothetical protein
MYSGIPSALSSHPGSTQAAIRSPVGDHDASVMHASRVEYQRIGAPPVAGITSTVLRWCALTFAAIDPPDGDHSNDQTFASSFRGPVDGANDWRHSEPVPPLPTPAMYASTLPLGDQ